MTIADRIQNLRKTKGISQEELADKIGVSRQAVSRSFPNKRILRNSPCLPACKQKNIAIKIRDTAYHKCVGISFLSL